MKKINTFSSRLMTLFLISIIVPMIISLTFLFKYFTNTLTKQNIEAFENTLSSVSSNIDTYLDDLQRLTLAPYMYDEIFECMSYLNKNTRQDSLSNIDLYNMNKKYSSVINKLINASRKDLLAITFIPLGDTSKSYLVSKYYDTLSEMTSPIYYEEWINETLKMKGDIFFTPVHNTTYPKSKNEYKVFSLMRVVKNLDTKRIIGIIKVDVKESTLKQIISAINISENSEFLLLDDDKQIIYSTHPDSDFSYIDKYYDKRDNVYNSSSHTILEKKVKSNNWTLLYLDSKQDLYSKTIVILLVIVILGSIFLLISIIFFRLKAKDIINSIYEITSNMEKLETGDMSIKANISGSYEFEHISNAINNISSKISSHIKNEYDAIIKQKKAEYIALQTQINPHFLNNILNGFIALNRIGEKKLLEDSLIQLSQFYRYTCKNSNTSTLEEEFYCIERYLSLEKLRFDDLIDFKLSLSDDTKEIKLPKLILQPLVENCIKHGFKDSGEPIFINVKSQLKIIDDTKTLMITIEDNGIGFYPSKSSSNNSTGVKNIKERLHLFESTSQLSIHSTPNVSTTCIINLPLKEDSNFDYFDS